MDIGKRKPGKLEMSKHFTGQIEEVSSTLKIMVLNFYKDSKLRSTPNKRIEKSRSICIFIQLETRHPL